MNRIFFILACIALGCSDNLEDKGQFVSLPLSQSGVKFGNHITPTEDLNYNTYPYIYMGGGVALGDINNDGLTDLFFTGNMVPNKLYLNQGGMRFEDISEKANMQGDDRWYTGVATVDINQDGWLDFYLCVSGKDGDTRNQLWVNNGDLTFTERAKAYGIADESRSIQATFFDYDLDGDLDLFVGNYPNIPLTQPNFYYHSKIQEKNLVESGHLYRNDGKEGFTEVTKQAGVLDFGLTLGVLASDFNDDGYDDLYISNDFNVPDRLYINNGDGTFSDQIQSATNQTSYFGMGVDGADFDNDGLLDLIQVDMTPEDHYRSKTNMASMDPASFYQGVGFGFHHQYMQNSLQLNNGTQRDNIPLFSNISQFSGVATTDWSWAPLFADFNNDGLKDIFITNGMRLDVNNNDFLNVENRKTIAKPIIDMHEAPVSPIHNYLYMNAGDHRFQDVSKAWNADQKGFSNGAAFGDLDNDGDLDLVLNNVDDHATVLVNELPSSNYLRIKLVGSSKNPLGMGAKITVKAGTTRQYIEQTLTRGFQSSVEPIVHFGLGEVDQVEQVRVIWPDSKTQSIANVAVDQVLELDYSKAVSSEKDYVPPSQAYFTEVTRETKIDFTHEEDAYDDFLIEPLLPYKNSTLGPGLSVADVNQDGLDDFYIGNARNRKGALYVQGPDGTFSRKEGPWTKDADKEDTGAVFLDVDADGDQDLYVVSGGNTVGIAQQHYQDRLYINVKGRFEKNEAALPEAYASGLKIAPMDYDDDGDLDLFLGGRIQPGRYLQAPKSYLLRNEGGKDTNVRFIDITQEVIPEAREIGLVNDVLWHDYNADGKPDLVLAGEWMPITFFRNEGTNFTNVTKELGFEDSRGWWFSLAQSDLDQDGDLDLVAGNLGLNSKYKTSSEAPFEVFVNDFDNNKRQDIVLSATKKGKRLPVRGRQCSAQQVNMIKTNFKTYEMFATATLEEIYGKQMLESSIHKQVDVLAHHWFENRGDGTYVRHLLPTRSQFSSISQITFLNYDGDDFPDMLVTGNLYNTEVETPRLDASYGLVLRNNKDQTFEAIPFSKSGLAIRGEVKAVASIKLGAEQRPAYLMAINNDSLRVIAQTGTVNPR